MKKNALYYATVGFKYFPVVLMLPVILPVVLGAILVGWTVDKSAALLSKNKNLNLLDIPDDED